VKNQNNKRIQYCIKNSEDLEKETELAFRNTQIYAYHPEMASAPLQGRYLKMMCQIKKPKCILEIGTFTGFATLCMAEGLEKESEIHTIEFDPENYVLAKNNISNSPYKDQINLYQGDALDIIPKLEQKFDFVFIDAAKKKYIQFFDLVLPKVIQGGIILVDNVLWFDKVMEDRKDPTTLAIDEFNLKIKNDDRVNHFLLPIEDGIQVILKK